MFQAGVCFKLEGRAVATLGVELCPTVGYSCANMLEELYQAAVIVVPIWVLELSKLAG